MKLSAINEYLQTLTTIGAILGLILVAYEVRHANRLAISQATSTSWVSWRENAESSLASGIAKTVAKSVEAPEELTLEDKMNLDFYYHAYIAAAANDVESVIAYDANRAIVDGILAEVSKDAPNVFGTAFGRAWITVNRASLPTGIAEAIERGLDGLPSAATREYFQEIDRAAADLR